MINFMDILAQDSTDFCNGLFQIIVLLRNVVKLLQWLIPMGLILFGMIDLGKAVIAGKEDEMKKAQGSLIKRVIYAIAIFFVVILVQYVVSMVGGPDWKTCWEDASNNVQGDYKPAEKTDDTNPEDCSDPNDPACN